MHNAAFHRAALGDFQLCSIKQRCAFSFWRVEQDFTAALLVAVCMSVAVRAPVYGSDSITAPSGNDQCSASAEANGAGLSSEKMLGSTKSVLSSPPRHRMRTCSPTDCAFQEGVLPARVLSQCSQLVVFFPVSTGHNSPSRLTAETFAMRIRLRSRR